MILDLDIHADPVKDKNGRYTPVGYVKWYEVNLLRAVQRTRGVCQETREEVYATALKERFHFAQRIRHTHPYSIPEKVLWMKLLRFVKEQRTICSKMYQPTFDFESGENNDN